MSTLPLGSHSFQFQDASPFGVKLWESSFLRLLPSHFFSLLKVCIHIQLVLIYITRLRIIIIKYPFGCKSTESSGGLVGLVITSTLSLCANIQWAIRQSAEAENQMTSVERALEYTKLESEAPFLSSEGGISIRFSCKL
jgi:hypothetical protein